MRWRAARPDHAVCLDRGAVDETAFRLSADHNVPADSPRRRARPSKGRRFIVRTRVLCRMRDPQRQQE
jgi:hypothetical protein